MKSRPSSVPVVRDCSLISIIIARYSTTATPGPGRSSNSYYSRPGCRVRACAYASTKILSTAETADLRALSPQNPLRFLRFQAIRDLAEVHKADRVNGQKPQTS